MHLIMFDIDGTLLESFDLDSRCYIAAVQDVLGIPVDGDWSKYTHVTDAGILRQLIEESGKSQVDQSVVDAVKKRFLYHLHRHLDKTDIKQIPGAADFLSYLKGRNDVAVSLATGGWRESALLKMDAAGLDSKDLIMATSSEHYRRTEIMKLSEQMHHHPRFKSRTYFGDGQWDKIAAETLGYHFILVGDRLQHDKAISHYEDFADIIDMIGI